MNSCKKVHNANISFFYSFSAARIRLAIPFSAFQIYANLGGNLSFFKLDCVFNKDKKVSRLLAKICLLFVHKSKCGHSCRASLMQYNLYRVIYQGRPQGGVGNLPPPPETEKKLL